MSLCVGSKTGARWQQCERCSASGLDDDDRVVCVWPSVGRLRGLLARSFRGLFKAKDGLARGGGQRTGCRKVRGEGIGVGERSRARMNIEVEVGPPVVAYLVHHRLPTHPRSLQGTGRQDGWQDGRAAPRRRTVTVQAIKPTARQPDRTISPCAPAASLSYQLKSDHRRVWLPPPPSFSPKAWISTWRCGKKGGASRQ